MIANRRCFLSLATVAVPAGLLGASSAWAGTCYDPATLPLSQKNRRRSIGYLEVAADPARRCQGCSFFTAAEPGCGECLMLNATVDGGASCASFAARTD